MQTKSKRRGLLYGGAVLSAAVLLFLGFGITIAPDLGTRLSGAAMLRFLVTKGISLYITSFRQRSS